MSYAKRDFLPDPYIHLSEGSGKFWDSESDSDYEDLGDAKVLAQAVQPNLRPAPAAISAVPPRPAVAVRPSPAAFSTAAPRPGTLEADLERTAAASPHHAGDHHRRFPHPGPGVQRTGKPLPRSGFHGISKFKEPAWPWIFGPKTTHLSG